jgi:hypothetical protein
MVPDFEFYTIFQSTFFTFLFQVKIWVKKVLHLFTHFTVIFQVKIRVNNFLHFSPTFSAENVYELLVGHLLEKS